MCHVCVSKFLFVFFIKYAMFVSKSLYFLSCFSSSNNGKKTSVCKIEISTLIYNEWVFNDELSIREVT